MNASQLWRETPGARFHSAVTLLALFTCWSVSIPGTHFFASVASLLAWMVLGGLWTTRWIAWCCIHRVWTRGDAPLQCSSLRWALAPGIGLLALGAVVSDGPMYLRFLMSRPALERAASELMAGARDPRRDSVGRERIGLFLVERQEAFPGGARFLVADSGFLDPCGFAYSVLGEPLRRGEDQYLPLLGKWYRWRESW